MMDLETLGGPQWAGWKIDGETLTAPEWRRGVTPGEIRAIPYLYASQRERRDQAAQIEQLRKQVAAVSRLCGWYHRQLSRESRLGLALSRLFD
jgi:hypothetical protein